MKRSFIFTIPKLLIIGKLGECKDIINIENRSSLQFPTFIKRLWCRVAQDESEILLKQNYPPCMMPLAGPSVKGLTVKKLASV